MLSHTEFTWGTRFVPVILGIIIDYFLSKQELTKYLYWRRLLNDTILVSGKLLLV